MNEEQVLSLLIITVKSRISYLERMIYEIGGNGPISAGMLQAEIDCLAECLDWLIDEARSKHFDFGRYHIKNKVGPND